MISSVVRLARRPRARDENGGRSSGTERGRLAKDVVNKSWLNLPNRITLTRLLASVVLFFLIVELANQRVVSTTLALWALILFVLVAATDWLDGYLARSLGQVTALGRVLDPFVDKVAVCGTFILLRDVRPLTEVIDSWMVVVIVAREFFVNDIRGYMESRGVSFGAAAPGKIKMLLQCITVGFLLGRVAFGNLLGMLDQLNVGLLWATLFATVGSGIYYLSKGAAMLRAAES